MRRWLVRLTGCLVGISGLLGVANWNAAIGAGGPDASPVGSPPCPVTAPNRETPPGQGSSPFSHGNGGVWTDLWPEGRVVFEPGGPGSVGQDGSLVMKWPWWWDAPGHLVVRGHRLDAPAPSLRAQTPGGRWLDTPLATSDEVRVSDSTPIGFMPAALIFPTAGCWQVTGTVRDVSLTFATLVVQVEEPSAGKGFAPTTPPTSST